MRRRASGSASTSYSAKSEPFHSSHSRISCVWGQRAAPKSSSLATNENLQGFADDVVDRGLHFLNARDVIARNHDGKIGQGPTLDFAAIVSEQRDGEQTTLARLFKGHDDV